MTGPVVDDLRPLQASIHLEPTVSGGEARLYIDNSATGSSAEYDLHPDIALRTTASLADEGPWTDQAGERCGDIQPIQFSVDLAGEAVVQVDWSAGLLVEFKDGPGGEELTADDIDVRITELGPSR